MPTRTVLPLLSVLFLAAVGRTQDFTETFSAGSNVGGWSAGGSEQILNRGGNPGAWLQSLVLSTAPELRTSQAGTPFTGDLRARGVASLGVDLRLEGPGSVFPHWRELTLVLGREQGLPGVWFDDQMVAVRAGYTPRPGEGWRAYDLQVPTAAGALPASWFCPGGSLDPDATWNAVVADVSWVMFFFGQPEQPYFVPHAWSIGIDNARVSSSLPTHSYCVGLPSSTGCLTKIDWTGVPSATQALDFRPAAAPVPSHTVGVFLYGFAPAYSWFNSLDLPCIAGPLSRSKLLHSGGRAGLCSGQLSLDFNAHIQSGLDPNLVAGAQVFGQFWYRDKGKPTGGSLSTAIGFTIQP